MNKLTFIVSVTEIYHGAIILRIVLKIRKKGILILPKKLREKAGINEGDNVIVEVRENMLIIKPLKPKIVDIDVSLLEELLREEFRLEAQKHREIFRKNAISS